MWTHPQGHRRDTRSAACRAVSQVALALALGIALNDASADQADYFCSISPSVVAFINELPLSEAATSRAAEHVSRLKIADRQGGTQTTPHPSAGVIWTDATGANAYVLHQIGHHVLYALMPEALRHLYWHPSLCADLLAETDSVAAGTAEDAFSESAAYFFALAFVGHQRLQGQNVDPGLDALFTGFTQMSQTFADRPGAPGRLAALCRLYGPLLVGDPAEAYADFCQTMFAYSRRSPALPLPARTISEWLPARQLYGGLPGVTTAVSAAQVAARFSEVEDCSPRLVVYDPTATLDVTVNGAAVTGVRVVEMEHGDRVTTGANLSILVLSPTTSLLLGPEAVCEIRAQDELLIEKGQLLLEGPAVLSTPVCHFQTGADSVTARVNLVGETTVGVVSGTVSVRCEGNEVAELEAGETVTVMANKRVVGPGQADPLQVAYLLPLAAPDVVMGAPAVPEIPAPPPPPPAEQAVAAPPDNEQGTAAALSSGEWQVDAPDLLPEAVLCLGVAQDNRPQGVRASFAPDTRRICLYLSMDFGSRERQVRIKWSHGPKTLSGRIIRAKGKRQVLNSLSCGQHGSFPPGDYQVSVTIDEQPGATLKFTVK